MTTQGLDSRKNEYNKFETLPLASYNITKYLMDNEETIWKLLKYSDADAWNKPNLSLGEKAALVYAGQPNETDFRVFNSVGQDNSWTVEACLLRISPATILPNNYVFGYSSIAFEVYCHYKVVTLSNYMNRIDYASQRLIECLNGAEIDGVGRLFFDHRASAFSKSILIGSIPYKGRATIMCNYFLG